MSTKQMLLAVLCILLAAGAVLVWYSRTPEEIHLTEAHNGATVEVKAGQLLVVTLDSNPSAGYVWEVVDSTLLRQMDVEFVQASELLGAPEKQILRFVAVGAGRDNLRLIYRRPWEEPVRDFSIQVALEGEMALPVKFDWRSLGVTSVKNQGNCGSCWAFGTVGSVESAIKIADKVNKDLSEQYLVSCNTDGWGCWGGWWAFDYFINKIPPREPDAGAVYETNFPYRAADLLCNSPYLHHEKLESWAFVGSWNEVPSTQAIKEAIYEHGPVAAAVCAGTNFVRYRSGILEANDICAYGVNHAIVLVGWDDTQGANGVWILKNSWGAGWGESGYMRIGYGVSKVGYSANYVVYRSAVPTVTPTRVPTATPTPTKMPTATPTRTPTMMPTHTPTAAPTVIPTTTSTPIIVEEWEVVISGFASYEAAEEFAEYFKNAKVRK